MHRERLAIAWAVLLLHTYAKENQLTIPTEHEALEWL